MLQRRHDRMKAAGVRRSLRNLFIRLILMYFSAVARDHGD
jgi:hypothetical protein